MALVLEDGTGKTNAQSYIDVAFARAYAAARGLTLPADDPTLEQRLVLAMDYLESKAGDYKGSKFSETQALQWPRINVTIFGFDKDPSIIPVQLKNAQAQLAAEIGTTDPMPTSQGFATREERIDTIATSYAIGWGTTVENPLPRMPKIDALLAPLLRYEGTTLAVGRA